MVGRPRGSDLNRFIWVSVAIPGRLTNEAEVDAGIPDRPSTFLYVRAVVVISRNDRHDRCHLHPLLQ